MQRRPFCLALATLITAPLPVIAQAAYPSRPLRLIVGFAPGGPADTMARAVAKSLEVELGQAVVVDNRAGAAGIVGLEALTNGTPDGYTLGLVANTTTTALHFAGKPLDIDKRLTAIGRFATTCVLLVVNPDKIDAKTLSEFVQYLRNNPSTPITSAGHGGIGHLGLERFALDQKLRVLHVSYRGSAPAMQDVIAGQVPAMVVDALTAMPHVQAGKLRAIASVSTTRVPSLPDLPTAMEQGFPSLQIDSSMGLVVPQGTPVPLVDRLRQALKAAVDSDAYGEAIARHGAARTYQNGEAFRAWLRQDFERQGEVIRAANIQVR